jgi:hypothetical protein
MMCSNYRAVTLPSAIYIILANILYVQLVPYAEEIRGKFQEGFRRGRSTVDQIFISRHILEKFGEQNTEVYNLCIDFQAA